jgi:hypothetical protein
MKVTSVVALVYFLVVPQLTLDIFIFIDVYLTTVEVARLYRVFQEERSELWEVIPSVILSKMYVYTCVLFRTVPEIQLFHCTIPKLLIRNRYYVQFLIPVFIVQVTKLVQFNTFSKIPPSTSMHFAARVRTWRVARLHSVQCTVQ